MKKQRLPIATIINGKIKLSEPYDYENRIVCEPYGMMSDGTMVWADADGNQYSRMKFFGKFYFCKM